MKRLYIILLQCVGFLASYAQINVLPGTIITIDSNTVIALRSAGQDTLVINAGSQVINNGAILLSSLNAISESSSFPITGVGFEEYTNQYPSPLSGINPGNLGFVISTLSATDSLSVKRYHTSLLNAGSMSIARNFRIESENNTSLGASISFNYDVTELNGYVFSDLLLYQSYSGNNWNAIAGTPATYNFSSTTLLDSLSDFSLFPFGLKIDSLNALAFYHGDSIRIHYTLNGALNPGNNLRFEFSDQFGSFAVPYVLDSMPVFSPGSYVFSKAIPVALNVGTQYRVRIISTDIPLISQDNGNDITILDTLTSVYEEKASGYAVYPNPAAETITIKVRDCKRITITDELGRILMVLSQADSEIIPLNISGLPPAVYFLTVETSNDVFHDRLVKN